MQILHKFVNSFFLSGTYYYYLYSNKNQTAEAALRVRERLAQRTQGPLAAQRDFIISLRRLRTSINAKNLCSETEELLCFIMVCR